MNSRALLFVFGCALLGCGSPPSSSPASIADAAGMCPEHHVLEALCTKHHPNLIAIFKSKGDWCEEHGFPESICPLCHPERGGRPDVDVTASVDDGAPKDGTRVKLKSPTVAKQGGIVTVAAVERAQGTSIEAVARVVYDAGKVAVVNARAAGVVRSVNVDVGAQVKKGATLAVLDSAAVGADRGNLQSARARLAAAESAVARETALLAKGISAQKDLQLAERERESARADVSAAEAALGIVGGDGAAGGYSLIAPIGGVVVERNVAVGQSVSSEPVLFQIVDPTSMWAEIDVAERDLGVVAVGQKIELVVDALPGRSFTGTINYIAPIIDVHSRTARARVGITNADGALRAQMFGLARIFVGAARSVVVVPKDAVQQAKDIALVFVKVGEVEYEARRVDVGAEDDAGVEVNKGVKAGEEVVTAGSFFLKTETLKGALGAGCCD